MSSLSTSRLKPASQLLRNIAVLEADTTPQAESTCVYVLEKKLNEVTEQFAREKYTIVRVIRAAGTESPESCPERFFLYALPKLNWIEIAAPVRVAACYFPGSSTDWSLDPKLHALVDPVFRWEKPFGEEPIEVALV